MSCSFFLHFCFIFRETCVPWKMGAHTEHVFMTHRTQFCQFNKTCSSRSTTKWPGVGGRRNNKCRISRSSWTSTGLKMAGNSFHGFTAYLLLPCSEAKVVKWSHTICTTVAFVIFDGWFTLQELQGWAFSRECVCYHCRSWGHSKIKVVNGLTLGTLFSEIFF